MRSFKRVRQRAERPSRPRPQCSARGSTRRVPAGSGSASSAPSSIPSSTASSTTRSSMRADRGPITAASSDSIAVARSSTPGSRKRRVAWKRSSQSLWRRATGAPRSHSITPMCPTMKWAGTQGRMVVVSERPGGTVRESGRAVAKVVAYPTEASRSVRNGDGLKSRGTTPRRDLLGEHEDRQLGDPASSVKGQHRQAHGGVAAVVAAHVRQRRRLPVHPY